MKKLLIAACALSLSGCALLPAMLGGIAPAPVEIANQTTMDERSALAAEAFYTGFARAGALAFRTGTIAPSTNPAVQRDDFCQLVARRDPAAEPTDTGMRLNVIECKLRGARDAARAAYDAGNALSYQAAFSSAMLAYTEGMALIGR